MPYRDDSDIRRGLLSDTHSSTYGAVSPDVEPLHHPVHSRRPPHAPSDEHHHGKQNPQDTRSRCHSLRDSRFYNKGSSVDAGSHRYSLVEVEDTPEDAKGMLGGGAVGMVQVALDLNQGLCYAKKASQHALIHIETLSKNQAQLLFTILYLAVAACTVISIVDYLYMWECTNICETGRHTQKEDDRSCGSYDSRRCMHLSSVPGVHNHTVTWKGSIAGLSRLNRFMHMSFMIDNPNLNTSNGSSLVSITKLDFQQVVFTSPIDFVESNFVLALSCSFSQTRCSTLSLPVSNVPWSQAYNMSVTLFDPPEVILNEVKTVSIIFQYQKATYTVLELVARMLMVGYTLYGLLSFVRRLLDIPFRHWLTEQQYILILFIFLIIYLDPLYPLATYDQRASGRKTGWWGFLSFMEFHCSTYFFLFVQVLCVVLTTSVRRTDGTVTLATHISCAVWLSIMVAIDTTVAVMDKDTASDYSSTFLWFFFTHDVGSFSTVEASLYIIALICEGGWLVWTARGLRRAAKRLRGQPYFQTRHRQLAFRYLIFMTGGFIFYQLLTSIVNWCLHSGFSVTYRSTQEIGAVIISFIYVHLLAYIYSPAFVDDDCPPAPCYPTWADALWKRVKWKAEWYQWLNKHGGSLYFFIGEDEQAMYLKAQQQEEVKSANQHKNRLFSIHTVIDTAVWVGQFTENLLHAPLRHLEEALFSEGYKGCPRLFFCLETCTDMLNLCYRVYYPPSDREIEEALGMSVTGIREMRLVGSSTILTIAGAVVCSSTPLSAPTPPPTESSIGPADLQSPKGNGGFRNLLSRFFRTAPPPEDMAVAINGTEPVARFEQVLEEYANLGYYGYRLFDCINKADMQVFVTVPTRPDLNHVVVSFRGTWNVGNAATDFKVIRRPWIDMILDEMKNNSARGCKAVFDQCLTSLPLLHSGFMELWAEIRGDVLKSLSEAVEHLPTRPTVYITGHSLGGAMACLCAYTATKELGLLPVVYTFGCPKMGNRTFQRRYNATVPNTFRVVNEHDLVAHWSFTWGNKHVGHEVCFGRQGCLLVEPTWIEQTFQPTKRGGDRMTSHSLIRYAAAINRICDQYNTSKRCLHPTEDFLLYSSDECEETEDVEKGSRGVGLSNSSRGSVPLASPSASSSKGRSFS